MTDRTGIPADLVTCSTQMSVIDDEGPGTRVDADLVYDPADPFAVSVAFHADDRTVTWTFGRELLVEGAYEPAGVGDVQVWPCLAEHGAAVVMIELFTPGSNVLLQASSRVVAGFVAEMLAAVPLGEEPVDLDEAVAALR